MVATQRYYLCPLIEAEDPLGFGTTWRPKIRIDHPTLPVATLTGPVDATGKPVSPWALCVVEAEDHRPLLRDPALGALPEYPFDVKVSSMNLRARGDMNAALQKFGVPTDSIQGTDGYRDVVRAVGRRLEPNFDEDGFHT